MSMYRTLVSAIFLLILFSGSGCTQLQDAKDWEQANFNATGQASPQSAEAGKDQEVYLKIVQEMLDKRLYYAALAHLQALEGQKGELTDKGRYLRAEALRRIHRLTEARALYLSLLDTPLSALGHHGLGLIAAENGDLEAAVQHLTRAAELRPVDARIRNDLGYALLLQGAFDEALFQLNTALELEHDEKCIQRNLVLLYYARGDEANGQRMAEHFAIEPNEVEQLRTRGQQLREHLQLQARILPPATKPLAAGDVGQKTPVPDESIGQQCKSAKGDKGDKACQHDGGRSLHIQNMDLNSPKNEPTALGAKTDAGSEPGHEPLNAN